ncbi:MAG: hypothetical protein WAV32_08105 [Halobacteriota archaeon]
MVPIIAKIQVVKKRKAKVFEDDSRACSKIADDSIDLIITSPPYTNNYDYADATRLEMSFFGEIKRLGSSRGTTVDGGIIVVKVTSPGHKLGQLIGNFFEEFFSNRLINLAEELGFYCDKKGLRPKVRGEKRKVTWTDGEGNVHELDYVFERNGTRDEKGEPAAFIELAWRQYTKHSRNKAGGIEAALVPLGNTYRNTCNFLGAILDGEFTEGARIPLTSHKINILYIPYREIVEAFLTKGINLDYPEDATNEQKYKLIAACIRPVEIK